MCCREAVSEIPLRQMPCNIYASKALVHPCSSVSRVERFVSVCALAWCRTDGEHGDLGSMIEIQEPDLLSVLSLSLYAYHAAHATSDRDRGIRPRTSRRYVAHAEAREHCPKKKEKTRPSHLRVPSVLATGISKIKSDGHGGISKPPYPLSLCVFTGCRSHGSVTVTGPGWRELLIVKTYLSALALL
jgi:hypothetical protein